MTKGSRNSFLIGWFICGLGALFYCYEYLLRIEPSVMTDELMQHFSISATGFGLLVSTYYAAYTPMQFVVGVLHDHYGPRRILTVAVLFCTVGSFLFGCTDSFYIAAFGRFLMGFGSAFAFVGVLKLAAIWLPSERFAMFAGLATALGMVGAMVGDTGMAHLVSHWGWQKTILAGSIIGLILSPITWLFVKDINPAQQITAPHKVTYKEAILGILKMVRNVQMWLAGIVGSILYLSLSVVAETWGPQFLEKVYHLQDGAASRMNTAIFAGWLIGGPIAGLISDRLRNRRLPLTIGSIFAAITISLIIYAPNMSLTELYSLLFLFGLFCSAQVICFAIGHENSPHALSASAVATINALVMLGGLVFQPIYGKLLDFFWDGQLDHAIRVYSESNYQVAMLMIPAALIISTMLTFFINKTPPSRAIPDENTSK